MDIWIDNRYFKINQNYTIFQYCAKIGINLPCFCYHEKLSIAGNCRICLVEANSALVVSCATLILDNMKIFTKTKRIKKAREGVLEFLLVNHPLDCPICDQGGECDLQDILMIYGSDRGRFYEMNKRSVTNINCAGPFIKTVMTRCIHCTRCVRFVNEISSVFNFGIIGRGSSMEIGTYINNFVNDELLGNIIDLCPVGALISMPASFVGRSWELKYIQSIDILDAIGTNIKIAIASNNVIRIIPCIDENYDEWITNKARFIYDSFNIQRLYYPKLKLNYKFIILSWKKILLFYLFLLKKNKFIEVFCGLYLNLELALILKSFFNSFGCSNINYIENTKEYFDFRFTYLLNTSIKDFLNIFTILLIGCNPRLEVPLLNSYIRKSYINNQKFKIYSIGLGLDYLTYPLINLGTSIKYFYKLLIGITLISKYLLLENYYNTYFINTKNLIYFYLYIGSSALIRNDSLFIINSILYFFFEHNINIKKFNIINKNLGKLTYSEINFNSIHKKSYNYNINLKSFNYLLGIYNLNNNFIEIKKKKILIFFKVLFLFLIYLNQSI